MTRLDRPGARSVTYEFRLLDPDLSWSGRTVPVLEGSPPVLTLDTTRAVMRDLSGVSFPPGALIGVNVGAALVQPMLVESDGTKWPLGVFLFADASSVLDPAGQTPTVAQLHEIGVIADQPVPYTIAVPAGGNVQEVIRTLLLSVGLALETNIYATTSTPVAFAPGSTTLLQACNSLAATAGCLPIHFTSAGVAQLRLAPSLEEANLTYGPGAGRVLDGSVVLSEGTVGAPNRWIALNSGASDEAIVGVYDLPASAPGSAANIGRIVARTVDVQGVPSTAAAQEAARAAALSDRRSAVHASFSSLPDPRHEPFSVVNLLGTNYLERSWSMTLLEGSAMTHDLRLVAA